MSGNITIVLLVLWLIPLTANMGLMLCMRGKGPLTLPEVLFVLCPVVNLLGTLFFLLMLGLSITLRR